jgi:hypothetical protein
VIRVDTGAFKLDDRKLVIHPELSLAEFRAGDIPITKTVIEEKHSGVYGFVERMDGLQARFQIEFGRQRLTKLRFAEDIVLYDQKAIDQELFAATKRGHGVYVAELKKWTEITYQARCRQRDKHDAWLEKVIGAPPPYEYNWGEIVSLIEPREGTVEILVRFKYDFGEGTDLKAYFDNQREQEHQVAMNPSKPFATGELPPGFRPKEARK